MNETGPLFGGIDDRLKRLTTALLVERDVRQRRDSIDLGYYLVNETARMHDHQLALLFRPKGRSWSMLAATDVSGIEDHSALGDWFRDSVDSGNAKGVHLTTLSALNPPEELSSGLPANILWLPLPHPDSGLAGSLLLFREEPFTELDRLIAEPLAECYGHALVALDDRPWSRRLAGRKLRLIAITSTGFIVAAGFWPISLTALAPAEIVAKNPVPITAPFDGTISEVTVRPYAAVKQGDLLVAMDATELTMQRDVAKKSLAVTAAELERYRHEAFLDRESKSKLEVWEARVELQRQEVDNAVVKLSRHRLSAPQDGVTLYDHRFNWRGLPVKAGQRLMTLADPANLEVKIDLPAQALIPLGQGDEVSLFMDMDPSEPVRAKLSVIGFQARPTPAGTMAYGYRADLLERNDKVILGARGTARLEGPRVPLAYALLRRPLAALRQFFGL